MKELTSKICPLCGPNQSFRVRYPAQFDQTQLAFVARKSPDHTHFRICQCDGCSLIFSNPIIHPREIMELYRKSEFIQEPQLNNMSADYLSELLKIREELPKDRERQWRLLEIGCSNGFFLDKARAHGFTDVRGIEPSQNSVNQALSEKIRDRILVTELKRELFKDKYFDIICFFQVFDHIIDPNNFLDIIHSYLRKDGILFAIHHNIKAPMPRLLGSRSSTYDISHIYLWDPQTMRLILEKHGFDVLRIHNTYNRYQLDHVIRMLPLPNRMKSFCRRMLKKIKLSDLTFRAAVENMVVVAKKK